MDTTVTGSKKMDHLMMRSWESLVTRDSVTVLEAAAGSAACIVVPTILRLMMVPALGTALPFSTYFPAALLATLLWGARWGTAVLVTSGLVAGYLFTKANTGVPLGSFGGVALILFLCAGALVVATGLGLRQALLRVNAAREAELLRKSEMQNRLKNTISIVQSFALFLSRKATDPTDFYRLLETRLQALAQASDVLFADHFETCALPGAAEAALAAFSQDGQISMSGSPATLDPASCEPLMLALHELATNAHKYGALSVPQGRVSLTWKVLPSTATKCVLQWVEKGGPMVHPPARSGLGSRLLRRQRGLDDVAITYDPNGLICELTVPLASG